MVSQAFTVGKQRRHMRNARFGPHGITRERFSLLCVHRLTLHALVLGVGGLSLLAAVRWAPTLRLDARL
jgi:hypothetical protein